MKKGDDAPRIDVTTVVVATCGAARRGVGATSASTGSNAVLALISSVKQGVGVSNLPLQ